MLILLVVINGLGLFGGLWWLAVMGEGTSIAMTIICGLAAAALHAVVLILAVWLGWERRQVCPECGTHFN
jgi:hypothetical protein